MTCKDPTICSDDVGTIFPASTNYTTHYRSQRDESHRSPLSRLIGHIWSTPLRLREFPSNPSKSKPEHFGLAPIINKDHSLVWPQPIESKLFPTNVRYNLSKTTCEKERKDQKHPSQASQVCIQIQTVYLRNRLSLDQLWRRRPQFLLHTPLIQVFLLPRPLR